ncbi:MAG TPA: FixH family protein [Saprospiraceae bacterium]|jgi:nitrogen fixation protein FixH|nr:FixH family protein [Saprospiraceae bacterium]MBK7698842.1 FixH family protein [Saprospiraceae bacterium]MBK8885180.1 FixH family protein [Saprospiraceae bacterium]MBK9741546.1 FixH family protein [Saprospiraceae bacterium]HMT52285.1 FixH family protein [Saprospiraceae bacterium]
MKFNWATGLTLFFILFIGTLVFVVYQSTQVHDSLVVENYYEEDINYQKHYDKRQNTADLSVKVLVDYNKSNQEILFTFPVDSLSSASGKILLYNPYSEKSDVNYDIKTDANGSFKIPIKDVKSGRWKLKIDWITGSKSYYQEEEIII